MSAREFLRLPFGWTGVAGAAAGILAAGCLHVQRASIVDQEREKLRFLSHEIGKLERETRDVDVLRPEIRALLARKEALKAAQEPRLQAARLTQEIASRRPEGVELSALAFTHGRALVRGLASSEKAIREFAEALRSSSYLALTGTAVEPPAPRGTARQFSLEVALRPEPGS